MCRPPLASKHHKSQQPGHSTLLAPSIRAISRKPFLLCQTRSGSSPQQPAKEMPRRKLRKEEGSTAVLDFQERQGLLRATTRDYLRPSPALRQPRRPPGRRHAMLGRDHPELQRGPDPSAGGTEDGALPPPCGSLGNSHRVTRSSPASLP